MNNDRDEYDNLPPLSLRYMVEDYEKLIKMGPPKKKNGSGTKKESHHKPAEKQVKRSA